MAITTEDGIVTGLIPPASFYKGSFTGEAAGYWHNLGVVAGMPGAWTLGTPGMAGATVTTSTIGGALNWSNPGAGNAYLAKLAHSHGANIIGFMVYDLLWYQSGIAEATTTGQTVNSVTWPARDRNGSTNGDGVEVWMHCTTATTNGAAITNTTITYTNSGGTGSRTGTILAPGWPASAVAGTIHPFGFSGSDVGVRSVQTVTLGTSYVGGQVELIAIRPIVKSMLLTATSGNQLDWASLGFPRIYNDSALYLAVLLSGTAAGISYGDYAYAHG